MATDPNLAAGIAAVRAGDLMKAQQALALVVRASPASEEGWWWMAQAVTDPERRKFCLERVLALNPAHAGALRLLAPASPFAAKPGAASANPAPAQPPRPKTAPLPAPPEPKPADFNLPRLTPAHPPPPPPVDYIGLLRAKAVDQQLAATEEPEDAPEPAPEIPAAPVAAAATPAASPAAKKAKRQPSGMSTPMLATTVGALTVTMCICMVAGALTVSPGLRAMVFGPPPPALVSTLTATAVVFPTLPPEWTATPTFDPLSETATPVPSRTPRVTATAQAADLNEAVAGMSEQIDLAREYLLNRQYTEALNTWDTILAAAPDYAYGHDQRGLAYSEWADRSGTYPENVLAALTDFDTAVALDGNVGDYWLHRYDMLVWLANNSLQSVDRDYWNALALESIRQANTLGNSDTSSPRLEGLVLAELGECAEAQATFTALQNAGADDTGGVRRGLAVSYACQNNYATALTNINAALAVTDFENWQLEKAAILYQLGRYTDALNTVNALIAANPQSCDCRLYLRALIYYELDDTEEAQADLELADLTGRASEGLREYLLGRMAQAAGNQDEAITDYQAAETQLKIVYTGLRQEITDRLSALGAAPLDLSEAPLPTATPIVSRPVPQPPELPPNLLRRPEDYIGEIIGQGGTGPFTLQPGEARDFQFQSVPPRAGAQLGFNVYLIGPEGVTAGNNPGLRLHGWVQTQNTWVDYELAWGAQQISDGVNLISNSYDIYTTVINLSGAPIEVVNLQIYIDDPSPP